MIRNKAWIYDVDLYPGQDIEAPMIEGLMPFLYATEGSVEAGGDRFGSGDAVSDRALPSLRATSNALLVLFVVDTTALCPKAGTISGS